MNKWIYELLYRIPFVPISWIFGSAKKLQEYAQLVDVHLLTNYSPQSYLPACFSNKSRSLIFSSVRLI
jgi:hypothetical protein